MTSTEIELRQNGHVAERDTIDGWVAVVSDVINVANLINDTDFVPAEYRGNGPAVAAAMLTGRELGIGPMMSLRHVQIVKGVPTLSAEYKRGRVLAAGHDFEVMELSTQRCKVRGRRTGTSRWLETSFSIDDAKRAKIFKPGGAWETRPRRMLFARAGSELCDFLFADVTNGLPTAELLAAGDGEDEFAGYDEAPGQAVVVESNGHAGPAKPPKPAGSTAQRRTRASTPRPAPSPAPAASAPGKPPDGPALPPLPGEDEPLNESAADREPDTDGVPDEPDQSDYDTPGTVTTPQLTAIWTVLRQVFGFTDEEKDQARAVAAHIIGRPITSTRQMSRNEAGVILDTLANWQETAKHRSEKPRDLLIAYLAAEAATDG